MPPCAPAYSAKLELESGSESESGWRRRGGGGEEEGERVGGEGREMVRAGVTYVL